MFFKCFYQMSFFWSWEARGEGVTEILGKYLPEVVLAGVSEISSFVLHHVRVQEGQDPRHRGWVMGSSEVYMGFKSQHMANLCAEAAVPSTEVAHFPFQMQKTLSEMQVTRLNISPASWCSLAARQQTLRVIPD